VFYFVGERARWGVLLAASLLFYAALYVPFLLVVLILVAITTYGFGIWLNQADTPKAKRTLLWGGIGVNLLILVVMKYLPFLSENLKALLALLSFDTQIQPVKIFVAIGVSYYIFQAISYLVDIYLEIEKPERHFGYFALYLAFFPKLLQGPIERAGDLIPQLKAKYEFNYDNVRLGMLLFALGLFKKVVVADRLGLYVDGVYCDVHAFSGLSLLLATYAYAFQIYMDFSGYTDMALGSARLFNINLTQNFNTPYLATSVIDFWRRWHISFSRWILDYIFKPLQMQWRNWKNFGTAGALIATFLVSGIWHGASWRFVIWGGLHGLYMALSVFYNPYKKKLHDALGIEKTRFLKSWQVFVTFNLVNLAWVFFRANSLTDALYVLKNIVNINKSYEMFAEMGAVKFINANILVGQGKISFLILVMVLTTVGFVNNDRILYLLNKPMLFRIIIYNIILISIIVFRVHSNVFIYFKF
jgi:D-alanyl-lipoteichoic acid acyltransferase DltB (MBOAT superfamily)